MPDCIRLQSLPGSFRNSQVTVFPYDLSIFFSPIEHVKDTISRCLNNGSESQNILQHYSELVPQRDILTYRSKE